MPAELLLGRPVSRRIHPFATQTSLADFCVAPQILARPVARTLDDASAQKTVWYLEENFRWFVAR